MNQVCFNGKIISGAEPVLMVSNRGYRYGDGLFETIKVVNGKILLADYHFERLFYGLSILKFEIPARFTRENLQQDILQLCCKNTCEGLARIRLSVFRGNGGLYDENKTLGYLIECWPLPETVNNLNENGLVIDIYPDARKSCDQFSRLKSANYLPYSMAALYAKENKLNDCLVLNTGGAIADSTIANVFLINKGRIFTPGLGEGCVDGVMRRHLLAGLVQLGYETRQRTVTINDIAESDEVFLTNAISGIQWVRQFRDKIFTNSKTAVIYKKFIKTIPV